MSSHLAKSSAAKRGILVLSIVASIAASSSAAVSSETDPRRIEIFNETSAKAHANILFPSVADEVFDGDRTIIRAIPVGGDVGVQYRFRLYPQPVRFQPICEMQTIYLRYEFAQRHTRIDWSIRDLDLLAMKRAGAFRPGNFLIHRRYIHLSPAPQTEEDHALRCRTADRDRGWVDAASAYEFQSEVGYLARLRTALSDGHVRLRCVRHQVAGCPVSERLILETIERERRGFKSIVLSDGSEWAEFSYFETDCQQATESRTLVVESRAGRIVSLTLIHGTVLCTAV